jgi:hypothetical protein
VAGLASGRPLCCGVCVGDSLNQLFLAGGLTDESGVLHDAYSTCHTLENDGNCYFGCSKPVHKDSLQIMCTNTCNDPKHLSLLHTSAAKHLAQGVRCSSRLRVSTPLLDSPAWAVTVLHMHTLWH